MQYLIIRFQSLEFLMNLMNFLSQIIGWNSFMYMEKNEIPSGKRLVLLQEIR